MEEDITERVAGYLAGVAKRGLPEDVTAKARLHLLDTLAAMISGADLRAGRRAAAFSREIGGPPSATVPGTGIVTDPVTAAFAGAMAAHADETDDSHLGGRFHPGCAVVPAALAVAEHRGRSGADLLSAITAGYDIGARATMALGFTGPRSGTHSTHCLGANFGAAAAAGVLAKLDTAGLVSLLSYATQQASGIAYWQRDPDHVEKAFDFGGMGARNGVFGALFVASGATGVPGSLTGNHSYVSAFAERPRPETLTDALGERFEIMSASIKKWSVGSPIQAALDSLEHLIAEYSLTAAGVAALRVTLPDDRFVIVDDRDMPDVCVQHMLALMLLDGGVSFATSHDRARMDAPEIREIRGKITAIPSADLTAARPARQAIVELDLADGRTVSHRTRAVRGTPDNPMTGAEVEAKARDLIAPVLGAARSDDLLAELRDIAGLDDVRRLTPLLQVM